MGAQLAQMGMGVADTVMAGRYGSEDLAGVALGSSILWPTMILFMGVIQAVTPTVSQLNAVLGTNLSAMELMNADYDERLNLLREGMGLDGQAFENLDRYTKLYVQNCLI